MRTTKKEIYKYLSSVKNSMGYIPKGHIINAYLIDYDSNFENIEKNVKRCTDLVYSLLKNKSTVKFS